MEVSILFKINGHYVYLTKKQAEKIFDIVTKNEDTMWRVSSKIIGRKENVEKNRRMENYIKNNFSEEYYRFNFYGEEAKDNIVEILFAYSTLTDTIKIFRADEISPSEELEEAATGYSINKIKIRIYEKNFLSWLFGKKDTGSSITIKLDEVNCIYGELTNFVLESRTFNLHFTTDNVNITYK